MVAAHLDKNHYISTVLTLCLTLASVLAYCLVLWTTPHGIGISPDTIVYLGLSESILNGNGFTFQGRPITHFPPVYPALLAIVVWLDSNHLQMIRILHSVLFAGNTFLIGMAAYLFSGRCFVPALAAVLLFIFSVDVLKLHNMAWSESLFIFLTITVYIVVTLFVLTRRFIFLILSAVFVSLTILTRYAGLPLVLPIILTVLLQRKPLRIKFRESIILVAIISLPLITWIGRNMLVSGNATNRSLLFHPITLQQFSLLPRTLAHFWLPLEFGLLNNPILFAGSIIGIVSLGFLILYGLIFSTKMMFQNQEGISVGVISQIMLLSYCATYLFFVVVSVSFFDAGTPLNSRILCPVYIATILFLLSFIQNFSNLRGKRWISFALMSLVILSISANGYRTLLFAREVALGGEKSASGYSRPAWKNSKTIAFVRSLPNFLTIYSDSSDAILFLTGKKSLFIPIKTDPSSLTTNTSFDQEMTAMLEEIREGRALIVYFDRALTGNHRWYLPQETEISTLSDVDLITSFLDGNVYGRNDLRRLLER